MREASERERALAWHLLAREAGSELSPEKLADALNQTFAEMYRRLAPLVGPSGFEALVARSVFLAKARYPYLADVRPNVDDGAFRFLNLHASVEGRGDGEVRDGLVAVFANFLWLLATFIGNDLALRLIRNVWPEGSIGGMESGSKEGHA